MRRTGLKERLDSYLQLASPQRGCSTSCFPSQYGGWPSTTAPVAYRSPCRRQLPSASTTRILRLMGHTQSPHRPVGNVIFVAMPRNRHLARTPSIAMIARRLACREDPLHPRQSGVCFSLSIGIALLMYYALAPRATMSVSGRVHGARVCGLVGRAQSLTRWFLLDSSEV